MQIAYLLRILRLLFYYLLCPMACLCSAKMIVFYFVTEYFLL